MKSSTDSKALDGEVEWSRRRLVVLDVQKRPKPHKLLDELALASLPSRWLGIGQISRLPHKHVILSTILPDIGLQTQHSRGNRVILVAHAEASVGA